MVTIRKRPTDDGTLYEVEDFPAYVTALRNRNIDTPLVQYGVFISHDIEQAIRGSRSDLEQQIGLFFRLGPSSGIDFRVVGP
jgi:hypothetical protein